MTSEPFDETAADPVEGAEEIEEPGWPVGFLAMLVLAGLYLLWRLIDLGIRFFRWVF